jgi:hypothetical protein
MTKDVNSGGDLQKLDLSKGKLQRLGSMDVTVAEILAALNDEEAAMQLIAQKNWTEEDLRIRTRQFLRQIEAAAAAALCW